MQNDSSRHWVRMPQFKDARQFADELSMLDSAGLQGVFAPQVNSIPWTALGAAAPLTERLKLGAGIALAFTRSPLETALAAMDLDRLSGGRCVLGLGPSVRNVSEGFYGAPYGKPVEHLREVIEATREIIASAGSREFGTFEGKYHRLDLSRFGPVLQVPVRTEIPIWIAATRKALIRLAGEVGDGLMGHLFWSVPWVTREVVPTLEESLKQAGRNRGDVHLNLWFTVAIDENRRAAIADARGVVATWATHEQYEEYFADHGYREEARACQAAARDGKLPAVAATLPEKMIEAFAICGTADEVRRKLEPAWEVADSFCLVAPGSCPPDRQREYRERIAEIFWS